MAHKLKANLTDNKDKTQYHNLKLDPEADIFSLLSTPKLSLENCLIVLV